MAKRKKNLRKTQGVYDLCEEILQTMQPPYGEDIIEKVCLEIEKHPKWRQRYEELCEDLQKPWIVNNRIGMYVKEITGMKSGRQVKAKHSKIIGSYTKLKP
jgi:hypothetical protein